MKTVDVKATVFGEVLSELMGSRSLEPTPERVAALAERSGMELDRLLVPAAGGTVTEPLDARIIDELALDRDEVLDLSWAFAYDKRR